MTPAASQKEIATLNAKMKYLADKIREYQGSEEAMNMALVSAQKLAKNIEEDAAPRRKPSSPPRRRKPTISLPPPRPSLTAPSARSRPTARPRSCATRRRAPPLRNTSRRSACCSTASRPFLTTLAEADLTGAVVTPAPAEKKAIAAPAEAAESETVEEEVLPAAEPEAEPAAEPETEEEESPLYPDAEDEQDYVKAFENAVYQKPEDSDTDAPEIKF